MECLWIVSLVLLLKWRIWILLPLLEISGVCVRSAGADVASHQYYWHQLIETSKLLRWQQRASAEARGVKERLCLYFTVRDRKTALCLACSEKLVCLSSLMFSGLRPSQWQKESFCTALCPLQRGCAALLHGKNSRETKPLAPRLQRRVERSLSQGSLVFPAVDTNWSG